MCCESFFCGLNDIIRNKSWNICFTLQSSKSTKWIKWKSHRFILVFNSDVDHILSCLHIFPLLPSGNDWLHASTRCDLSDWILGCLRGTYVYSIWNHAIHMMEFQYDLCTQGTLCYADLVLCSSSIILPDTVGINYNAMAGHFSPNLHVRNIRNIYIRLKLYRGEP